MSTVQVHQLIRSTQPGEGWSGTETGEAGKDITMTRSVRPSIERSVGLFHSPYSYRIIIIVIIIIIIIMIFIIFIIIII